MKLSAVVLASAMSALVGAVATADTVSNADSRNVIAVDTHARAELLAEMRAHLVNIQALLEALSKGNMKGATQAARASGVQSASESADDIIAHLPSGFTALGMSMHRDFDRIADMAERGGDAQTLLRQVAVTMQKCVVCHTNYRFRVDARTESTR
ncbi:MAG: hypothetical protein ABJD53_02540 [Gammaproteobacteria bacterium]